VSGHSGRQGVSRMASLMRHPRVSRSLARAVLLGVLATSPLAAAQPVLEVYETYWPADKLLPVIKAELRPTDTIQVFRNKLVIRAERDTHDRITELLAAVDRAPRNVLISIRQGEGVQNHADALRGDVTISTDQARHRVEAGKNEEGQVRIYQGSSLSGEVHTRVVHHNSISTRNDRATQQVRVLEGEEARISLGEDTAQTHTSVGINGVSTATTYQSTGQFLYVTPQVTPKGIRLTVSSRSSRQSDTQADQVDTQALETVILAEEGFWTPIGGTGQDTSSDDGSITWSTRALKERSTHYEIKAELLQ
jgi:hypothetical protein